jgi:hypothetical protein
VKSAKRVAAVITAVAVALLGAAPAGAGETAPPTPSASAGASSSAEPSTEPSPSAATTEPPAPVEPAPTALTLGAPASGYIGRQVTLRLGLTEQETQAGVAGAEVYVERWDAANRRFLRVGEALLTSDSGTVSRQVTVRSGLNRFRAVFPGSETHAKSTSPAVDVTALRIPTRLTLGGKDNVVDEQSVRINLRWEAEDGRLVTGRAKLYRQNKGSKTWSLAASPRVVDGAASVVMRPRVDTVWKAVGPRGTWYRGDTSGLHRIDNVPPMKPVVLPDGAPRPSVSLPAQRRAAGAGLNPVVSRIPNTVWRSMVGRSWHSGCPVGRANLRLVRLNYWGFDGYRHRGELVVHRTAAGPTVNVFRTLYSGKYPVRSMYRVDRFGWSKKLQGANDYKSMAADNTSAFNCRQVVGRPGVRSPHSYGDSIDINPWENPYVSQQGTYPNTWWLSRSHAKVAWRSWTHPVVQAFGSRGFAWGGAYRDYHHFQR